ncbi:MAG TPA: sigma-70 family RNA polymerase sigma factor [Opitutaceae bacterium]|nr:sigma-70 family RNA polymerase sigma factor [Opitutaceae bacterium]
MIPSADTRDAGADLSALTAALARGDDAAWARFDREFGPAMLRQLLAVTRGDFDLAKEAQQRAYLRIARHVRPCESLPMFRVWIRTVARTALLDCWRRRRSFLDLLQRRRQQPPELDDPAADDRLTAALDAALVALAPADRLLLEEKYLAGATVAALAVRLELSAKAVESRLSRARGALRNELLAVLARHE